MRIIVFGATGDVGSRIVGEAMQRGHQVTAVVRTDAKAGLLPDAASVRVLDVADTAAVATTIAGHDLVISALRPPEGHEPDLPGLTRSILDAAAESKIPALIVGGAANLLMPDGSGHTVLTAPDFLPDAVRPIAAACLAQYAECASAATGDWTYFSPPAMLQPGERTGRFRRGSDVLLVDEAGQSQISMEDFAVAIIDMAERSDRPRRVTVAY